MERIGRAVSVLAVGVVVLGTGIGWLLAEEAQQNPAMKQLSGKIASVDRARGAFTVDEHAGPVVTTERRELFADDGTEIIKAGTRLRFTDLQASNDPVTIQFTDEESKPQAKSIVFEKPDGLRRAEGSVGSVDLLKGELVMHFKNAKQKEPTQTFALNEATVISQDGQRQYLAELKPGDEIAVEYADAKEAERPLAYSVTVTGPPPAEENKGEEG